MKEFVREQMSSCTQAIVFRAVPCWKHFTANNLFTLNSDRVICLFVCLFL